MKNVFFPTFLYFFSIGGELFFFVSRGNKLSTSRIPLTYSTVLGKNYLARRAPSLYKESRKDQLQDHTGSLYKITLTKGKGSSLVTALGCLALRRSLAHPEGRINSMIGGGKVGKVAQVRWLDDSQIHFHISNIYILLYTDLIYT